MFVLTGPSVFLENISNKWYIAAKIDRAACAFETDPHKVVISCNTK